MRGETEERAEGRRGEKNIRIHDDGFAGKDVQV